MSSDAERVWDLIAGKLRKQKGLCPPTPEEAALAFKKSPAVPLSPERIESIVESVMTGKRPERKPDAEPVCQDETVDQEINDEAFAMCRNEGDGDQEADRVEKELEEKLLTED